MRRFFILIVAIICASSAMAFNKDSTKPNNNAPKYAKEYRFGKRGYFGTATLGFSHFGIKGEGWLIDKPHYGVDVINGYSFNPHFDLGAGVGFHFQPSSDPNEQYLLFPLYAYLRANILDRRVTPYIAAKLGASAVGYRTVQGCTVYGFDRWGWSTFTEIEAGAAVRFKDGKSLNIGVGVPAYLIPLLAVGVNINVGFTW